MSRRLNERKLPLPAAASEVIRSAISTSQLPLVEELGKPPPETKEQWLAVQHTSSVNNLDELAEQMGVDVSRDSIGGVAVFRIKPKRPESDHKSRLFLHLHAGGYVLSGGDAAPSEAALISGAIGIESISIDYRMPPKHPFPAAVEDVVTVYRDLIQSRSASSVVLGGTSAGGGLALSAVHQLVELGLDVPGAIWVGTPWADLSKTGDSLYTNEGVDRVLMSYDGMMAAMARLYAGEQALKHPLISPVYGEFNGFPPTQLVSGTRDMFLSDTVRTHRKLRAAGILADLNVYEGLSHAEYLMVPDSPETQQVFADMDKFIRTHVR